MLKASELVRYITDIMEAHGDQEIRVPGIGGDLPIEGVLAILVEPEGKGEQYYLIADAETIDGIDAYEGSGAAAIN